MRERRPNAAALWVIDVVWRREFRVLHRIGFATFFQHTHACVKHSPSVSRHWWTSLSRRIRQVCKRRPFSRPSQRTLYQLRLLKRWPSCSSGFQSLRPDVLCEFLSHVETRERRCRCSRKSGSAYRVTATTSHSPARAARQSC